MHVTLKRLPPDADPESVRVGYCRYDRTASGVVRAVSVGHVRVDDLEILGGRVRVLHAERYGTEAGFSLTYTIGSTGEDPDDPLPPVANFTSSTTSGTWLLAVAFTDTSTESPTSWAWDFGDGVTSTLQNPSHSYTAAGVYTVSLTATNAAGSDTETKTALITVTDPPHMLGGDQLHPNNTGMAYLAGVYADALAAAGKTPAAGTALYAYGDSWTASDIENTAGQRAIVQFAAALGLTLTNRAVSGYKIGDCAARSIGTGAPFVAGTAGLAFLQAGVNDLAVTDSPALRTTLGNYLRAMFAVLCAAQRIEQTTFTLAGTWASNSISSSSGGSNRSTSVDGATATVTITTPGTYYLLAHGTNGTTDIGGKFIVSQGGVTLAEIDTNGQANPPYTSFYGNLSLRIPAVAAGDLTITHSTMGRAGAVSYFDALVRISATPPTILAVKPVRVLISNRLKPALLDHIRGLYDVMATEFGANVVVADPAPSWNP